MPDWDKIRSNYPALENYVYLNTAGTGIVSVSTAKRACSFYDTLSLHGNSKLDYHVKLMKEARRQVASLIGAQTGEIAFAPNTSHGMNIAALMFKDRRNVITTEPEFPSSTVPWIHHGYKVKFVGARNNAVPLEEIEKAARATKPGVIVHSFVQFGTGFRQDMKALGEIARRYGFYFVANITQGCGAFPVNVRKWQVDVACCTGIKWLCAGEGAGFMYMRKGLVRKLKPPVAGWFSVRNFMKLDNRKYSIKDKASRVEVGGPAFPNIHALGNSVKELRVIKVRDISKRILELTGYMIDKLHGISVKVLSPLAMQNRSGILLIKVPGPNKIAKALSKRNVMLSARMGGLRVSLHFYNNFSDIDRFVKELKKLL